LYEECLLSNKLVEIVFVNDGSIDNTQQEIERLENKFPKQVKVLRLDKNLGKGEAVRKGVLYSLEKKDCKKIAFLDADLSTSLSECISLSKMTQGKVSFVFGSRILKIDNNIQRKWYRFILGRIIATFISKILGVAVYDTQCGCKIFSRSLAKKIFGSPFISKWLFDVEIFFRIILIYGEKKLGIHVREVPLSKWIDTSDSRVKASYFFKLWFDLYKISRKYNR